MRNMYESQEEFEHFECGEATAQGERNMGEKKMKKLNKEVEERFDVKCRNYKFSIEIDESVQNKKEYWVEEYEITEGVERLKTFLAQELNKRDKELLKGIESGFDFAGFDKAPFLAVVESMGLNIK